MKIIYVSSACSKKTFNEILTRSQKKIGFQGQKFHSLLIEGLSSGNQKVEVISARPTSRQNTSGLIFGSQREDINENLSFHNLYFINLPILRQLCLFFGAIIKIFQIARQNKSEKPIIICDILTLSVSISSLLVSRILKIRTLAIVTDLPQFLPYTERKNSIFRAISVWIANFFMTKHDSYLLLTQRMNPIANPKDKPYIIIEGLSDLKMSILPKVYRDKSKKILLYAGSLHRLLGVSNLLESFKFISGRKLEFWFFGVGELEQEIKSRAARDNRVKYFGLVPDEKLLESEIKATLLINPRPTDLDFSAYSFPSKIMEYMASGTPVISTILESIPGNYKSKLYFFKSQKAEDIASDIVKVLDLPDAKLRQKGAKARSFILKEKNNIRQSKKIIRFILENFTGE